MTTDNPNLKDVYNAIDNAMALLMPLSPKADKEQFNLALEGLNNIYKVVHDKVRSYAAKGFSETKDILSRSQRYFQIIERDLQTWVEANYPTAVIRNDEPAANACRKLLMLIKDVGIRIENLSVADFRDRDNAFSHLAKESNGMRANQDLCR